MRKTIGEYKDSLRKLYGSLRRRFGLGCEESLEVVDKVLLDSEFKNYPVILISNDDQYSNEFIKDVNESGIAKAYGFYKDGAFAYKSVAEVREMVPKLVERKDNVFVYVSVDIRSFFRLQIPGTICIKQGRVSGQLSLDIIKTRPIIEDEEIRKVIKSDMSQFNELLNDFYIARWQKYPEIFDKGYKLAMSEFFNLCNKGNPRNAVVCVKNERIVGFMIYEYISEDDNRAFRDSEVLTITDVYVKEAFRNKGIATRMYEKIVKLSEKHKTKRIRFKVWEEDVELKKFVLNLKARGLYTLQEVEV